MAAASKINFIDGEEYPSMETLDHRCVSMISRLFHAPRDNEEDEAVGTSTIGSSEAIILAVLAAKRRWKNKRKAEGKSTESPGPNIVMNAGVQVCWEKAARVRPISLLSRTFRRAGSPVPRLPSLFSSLPLLPAFPRSVYPLYLPLCIRASLNSLADALFEPSLCARSTPRSKSATGTRAQASTPPTPRSWSTSSTRTRSSSSQFSARRIPATTRTSPPSTTSSRRSKSAFSSLRSSLSLEKGRLTLLSRSQERGRGSRASYALTFSTLGKPLTSSCRNTGRHHPRRRCLGRLRRAVRQPRPRLGLPPASRQQHQHVGSQVCVPFSLSHRRRRPRRPSQTAARLLSTPVCFNDRRSST